MKYIIWALIMGFIMTSIKYIGAIPCLLIEIATFRILDFIWKKFEEKSDLKKGKLYKCPYCNSINETSNDYCSNCGKLLKDDHTIQKSESETETSNDNSMSEEGKTSDKVESMIKSFISEDLIEEKDNNTSKDIPALSDINVEQNNDELQIDEIYQENTSDDTGISNFISEDKFDAADSNKQDVEKTDNKRICFCRYCGNKLNSDFVYCNKCGKKIN